MRIIHVEIGARACPPQPDLSDPDDSVIWVPTGSIQRRLPDRVIHCYRRIHGFDFKYFRDGSRVAGLTLGGLWDRGAVDALSFSQAEGFRQRFIEGRPWKEASPYREIMRRSSGAELKAWLRKMERWDALFEDMRTNGFRRQGEVRDTIRTAGPYEGSPLNEIQVVMARSGELLRVRGGGKHRFMMAKILNIPEIPVIVNVRHAGCPAIARSPSARSAKAAPVRTLSLWRPLRAEASRRADPGR